jgi:hypothetical protein
MTWKQFLCAMTGHSIITRSQQGQRFFACYACDRKLSRGWDLRDTRHQRFSVMHAAYRAFRRQLDSSDQVAVGVLLVGYTLMILAAALREFKP